MINVPYLPFQLPMLIRLRAGQRWSPQGVLCYAAPSSQHVTHNVLWNIYIYTTNSMGRSSSWEANSRPDSQETISLLWNQKVHYSVHNTPMDPILSQTNPIHNLPPYLRSILKLSSHLRLGLSSGLFTSGTQTKILHAFPNYSLSLCGTSGSPDLGSFVRGVCVYLP
jgi:hypothetical protein